MNNIEENLISDDVFLCFLIVNLIVLYIKIKFKKREVDFAVYL